jgi:hypothetical protein
MHRPCQRLPQATPIPQVERVGVIVRRIAMKLMTLTAAIVVLPLLWTLPLRAENPLQVKQLLETNLCQSCDLSGAQLTQAHLIGADLRGLTCAGPPWWRLT